MIMRENIHKGEKTINIPFLFEELHIPSTQELATLCKYVIEFPLSLYTHPVFSPTKLIITDVVLKSLWFLKSCSKGAIYFLIPAV